MSVCVSEVQASGMSALVARMPRMACWCDRQHRTQTSTARLITLSCFMEAAITTRCPTLAGTSRPISISISSPILSSRSHALPEKKINFFTVALEPLEIQQHIIGVPPSRIPGSHAPALRHFVVVDALVSRMQADLSVLGAFAFVSTISPILLLRHLFPAASVPHFHLPSTSGAVAPSTSAFTLVRFFAHAFYYIRYQCELLHSKHDHSVHSITSSCAFRERHSFPASAPAVASRHESRQTKHFHHRKSLRVRLSSATSHHG